MPNFDRFKGEDWPMLPHSEPESYPDDWEQIKPKSLLPVPMLAEPEKCKRDGGSPLNQRHPLAGEARESIEVKSRLTSKPPWTLAAGI